MFKNKLVFALLITLAVVLVVIATRSVSAGDGTGGHLGGIIASTLT